MQVHIPQPCTESWAEMSPSTGGRFCAKCAHTVIDFSQMSAEEIALYLRLNAGKSICGRFRAEQLMVDLPTPDEFVVRVVKAPLSLLRQIAAIIIFTLFLSTNAVMNADAQKPTALHPKNEQPVLTGDVAVIENPAPQKPDTQSRHNEILGRMPLYVPQKGKGAKHSPKDTTKSSDASPHPQHLAGKVAQYPSPKK